MDIKFKLFGLTEVIGENEVKISLPQGSSLEQAISKLVEKYGDALKHRLLSSSGRLHDHIRLVVDGRIVDRLEEKIEGETTIFVLHEIAGG